ncbi:MAG: glycosyltransferase family 4 protein [Myxococcota bacterium]|nr:glycosyltransferase family 4 protein [Myxococcota bacterium]
MKLLLVAGRFPQRSETFIYRKAVGLAGRGHHVTVASRSPGEWSIYPDPLPATMTVEVWPPDVGLRSPERAFAAVLGSVRTAIREPTLTRTLLTRVRADQRTRAQPRIHALRHLALVGRDFDVIHFEFLGLASMYPLARELTGARIVVSCRGTETHTLSQRPAAEQASMLATFRDADAVHCVSAELAASMAQLAGVRPGVWINRPALDVEAISPRDRRGRGGPLRIITTGRLVWQKGFDHLLAAFARLRQRGVAFHAQIVGDGELRRVLAFSISALGLDAHVELVGAVSSADVLARMLDADVFVLSSHTEGISNAAIEAMAAGLPIVTTAAGGMTEVVTDGVEGFVVPVRDPEAMAARLATLAVDEPRRLAMGAAARARAVAELSIERQVNVFEELYASLGARDDARGSSTSSR